MVNIKFQYGEISVDLRLERHLTVVVGDSGTGKTFLYEALPKEVDHRVVHKFTYGATLKYMIQEIKESHESLFVIDRTELIFCDALGGELKEAINSDVANTFLLFGRDIDGLDVRCENIKQFKLVNNMLTFL